jgi:small subunit ribosomal protein S17
VPEGAPTAEPEVAATEVPKPDAAEVTAEVEPAATAAVAAEPDGEPSATAAGADAAEEPGASAAETEAASRPAEAPADIGAEPAPPRGKRKRLARALRHRHAKPVREPRRERAPITRVPKPEKMLGRRQERRGVVVSDKGDKSIVVKVETTGAHPRYKKVVRRSHRLHAHDERNDAAVGDVVRIVESRPLSKTKHWRLVEILEKAR